MTWDEMAARILQMTPEQRQKKVRFVEPYDERTIFSMSVLQADSVIPDYCRSGKEEDLTIHSGEFYLGA